jgi:hypothetical protein
MKNWLTLTPLKAVRPLTGQERYQNFQQLLDELILALTEVALIGGGIITLVALWKIYHKQIHAAFFAANEFIKPLWGG